MNVAFVERLNASVANVAPSGEWRAKPFVTGAPRADPGYEVSRVADQVLAEFCAHVQLCKCDC